MTNSTQSAAQFEHPFAVFLANAMEEDFIVFENPVKTNEFVQFKLHNGVVYGEVSSRQWGASVNDHEPLSDAAEFALIRLGFTHGGRAKNYCMDDLPASAKYLATLTARLFETAFETPAPVRPDIRTTDWHVARWAERRGQLTPIGSPKPQVSCPCGYRHRDEPPLETSPGLAARVLRALRSNFMEIQLDCEDRQRLRRAVEAVGRFEDLPDWAQDWILKAEDGPLFS
ncbi:MAG: TY-Chap domain-containing protein [Candidatus Dormibacteria bacterium]